MEDKKKREKKWLIFIIGIGALLIVLGLNTLFKAFSTYFWSSTQGKILVSQVGFVDRFKRENDSFYFDISYEYSVDGKLYTNSKVFLGQYGSSISNWMQKVVDRYPVGKEVSVYYNPKNPKEAVLERGVRVATFGLFIGGLLFVGIGILGLKT